jgi:signal transduction histidine kinase
VRLQQAVDELDETIREIRITIFDLEARDAEKDGLRTRVLSLTGEATATLGFAPKVHMDGPLEAATDAATQEELLKTLREALSNVVRHANASSVEVLLRAASGTITLRVADNGVGLPKDARHGQHADPRGVAGGRLRGQRAPRRRDDRHLAGSSLALRGGHGQRTDAGSGGAAALWWPLPPALPQLLRCRGAGPLA